MFSPKPPKTLTLHLVEKRARTGPSGRPAQVFFKNSKDVGFKLLAIFHYRKIPRKPHFSQLQTQKKQFSKKMRNFQLTKLPFLNPK